jgi:hypothetical protein
MSEHEERVVDRRDEVAGLDGQVLPVQPEPGADAALPEAVPAPAAERVEAGTDGAELKNRHAEAGRKGGHRVHQLIQEGLLYEMEHGLKRGRQRLRQLIELGKVYEQEHGLRPSRRKKRGERLSRLSREELLATFLRCLVRIAKPSFRAELRRLVEVLSNDTGHAA